MAGPFQLAVLAAMTLGLSLIVAAVVKTLRK